MFETGEFERPKFDCIWILIGLNPHATELIFLTPVPANEMELFPISNYAKWALRTPEA